ncbi:MAG: VacJ family lipoprotein [Arcobacter sp.]|nr:VacJ family lipoprotein [Arcobacter sp.]
MKNFTILLLIVITFNACTFTSYHKINNNLEFEYLEESERKTYKIFGKDKFLKEVSSVDLDDDDDFSNEFKDEEELFDPLEPYNRVMTSFNDYVYINLLNPVAEQYKDILPEQERVGISNFFHNITFPIRFVNNILQFKFAYAGEELSRFAINSTLGIFGFLDPAKEYLNLKKREEDFGQTLGYYGLSDGMHIVLPLLGPSNLRDLIGLVGDNYVNPLNNTSSLKYKIPKRTEQNIAVSVFNNINRTSLNLGKYENLKKDAFDLYPLLRDIYNQNRIKLIKE